MSEICRAGYQERYAGSSGHNLQLLFSGKISFTQGSHNPFLKAFQFTESGSIYLGLSRIIFFT